MVCLIPTFSAGLPACCQSVVFCHSAPYQMETESSANWAMWPDPPRAPCFTLEDESSTRPVEAGGLFAFGT